METDQQASLVRFAACASSGTLAGSLAAIRVLSRGGHRAFRLKSISLYSLLISRNIAPSKSTRRVRLLEREKFWNAKILEREEF